ncbi:hypothetical protein BH24DEI2_BH24DEI2_20780 [soil metagenome]
MTTYGFRIRFLTPAGRTILGAEPELTLSFQDVNGLFVLRKLPHKENHVPGTPETFVLIGSGFCSEENADAVGRRLKTAIAMYGASTGMGVDCGRDKVTSSTSTDIKTRLRDQFGIQLRDTVHGLDVYAEDLPIHYLQISGTLTVVFSAKDFSNELVREFNNLVALSPKLSFALELYNLTHFEPATKARFLSLVTVVEVLSTKTRRPKPIRDQINAHVQLIRDSGLPTTDKELIISGLGNLKRESIGAACRALVAKYLDADAAEFFSECYAARSELLHEGDTKREIVSSLSRLDEVVRATMLSYIRQVN